MSRILNVRLYITLFQIVIYFEWQYFQFKMVILKKYANCLFFASKDNIMIYNLGDGTDQQLSIPEPILPDNLTTGQLEVLKKEVRTITSMDFSYSGDYLVVSTENKQVIVYDKHFCVTKNIIVNRVPSKVCFTTKNDIIIADKTGDVYLYKFKHESSKPTLLLGHLSVILDVIISECGKFIITCDRDEKIRVSHYPNCYNISSFCLGHTEFVTYMKLVKNILASASGDGTVRFWNYIEGEQLGIINTNAYIDDSNLLQKFTEQMDKEKVDVSALPVTDMQLYLGEKCYIAVSIYNYNNLQLYAVDLTNFKHQYIRKISFMNSFSFTLSENLYVLTNKLVIFELIGNNYVECELDKLQKFYRKYEKLLNLENDHSVTVLFKRKFDNVQEYLKRKKQRLGAK